jgi:hypothetical protein
VVDPLDTAETCDEAREDEEETELALSEGRRELGCEVVGELVGWIAGPRVVALRRGE